VWVRTSHFDISYSLWHSREQVSCPTVVSLSRPSCCQSNGGVDMMNSARNCLSHHTLFHIRRDRQPERQACVCVDTRYSWHSAIPCSIRIYKIVTYMFLSNRNTFKCLPPLWVERYFLYRSKRTLLQQKWIEKCYFSAMSWCPEGLICTTL
jgi:hypothetical protein